VSLTRRCVPRAPQATNKEQNITIKSSGGLSDEQVEQMVRDAETFAGEDKKRKDGIEAKNEAETLVYSAEKSLHEYKVQHLSSKQRRARCVLSQSQGVGFEARTLAASCWVL